MKDLLIKEYSNTQILNIKSKQPINTFSVNFIDGAFLEVIGPLKEEYKVTFTNTKTNEVVHNSVISNSMWTRTSKKYCIDWKIEVFIESTNKKIFEYKDEIAEFQDISELKNIKDFPMAKYDRIVLYLKSN